MAVEQQIQRADYVTWASRGLGIYYGSWNQFSEYAEGPRDDCTYIQIYTDRERSTQRYIVHYNNLSEKAMHPTPVLLSGKSHGWRSLVGCSPWGREESDMTEWLHFDFSLSCTGEGNGNPLQCSCLGNLMDRGACWAMVHGVAKSWTQLNNWARMHISPSTVRPIFIPFLQYRV